jgi:hypothetical protein
VHLNVGVVVEMQQLAVGGESAERIGLMGV